MEEDKVRIPLSVAKIKMVAITKSEMYKPLTHSGKYYLPPQSQTDGDFIHEIMSGFKKVMIYFFNNIRFSK